MVMGELLSPSVVFVSWFFLFFPTKEAGPLQLGYEYGVTSQKRSIGQEHHTSSPNAVL